VSNPAKAKGTKWESALVDHLTERWGVEGAGLGLVPRRVAQSGPLDTGDLHGLGPFVAQAKNYKDLVTALRVGVDGAVAQAARAGARYGVAFLKRPRKGTGEAYAVMRLDDWADMVAEFRFAEEEVAHLRAELNRRDRDAAAIRARNLEAIKEEIARGPLT
jgi:hypothetical protein